MCNVNHETEVAFLAVTGPRENETVAGSACYFLNPATNLAEIAFMVAPDWQGRGLGSLLQKRLEEYALTRDVRGFTARNPAAQRPHAGFGQKLDGQRDHLGRRRRGALDHPVSGPVGGR